jgi:RNA 3'-terminal phosphate cyclase (ATP)
MPNASALIVIDGSYGEGGGALVRTALAMAAVTQQGVRIENIRAGTRFAGLDSEDLTLLSALTTITAGEAAGATLGSTSLSFLPARWPKGLNGPLLSVRTESNRIANAPVVLSALLPVLARTQMYSSLLVEGETYGVHSLSYDYFANVTLYAQRAFGLHAYPTLEAAGFGRESQGEVVLDVEPSVLQGIQWTDRGTLRSVQAVVATNGVSNNIGERALSHLRKLAQTANLPMNAVHVQVPSKSTGVFITTWATYDRGVGGGGAMGGRGLRVEMLAQNAFTQTFEWMSSDATVDPFLADQILLSAVLAEGESTFKTSKLTQRFLTTVWVVKQFTPIHITVRGTEGNPGSVTVRR